jgi:hypothetical protein
MAGFSQDLPTSPQSIFQRLNTTSTNSSTSSSSEMEIMRNRVLQMQALAMTEKEVYKLFLYLIDFVFIVNISSPPIIGVVKQKKIID